MMNGFNQYLCNFCQQPCKRKLKVQGYGKAREQLCNGCSAVYVVNTRGIVRAMILFCNHPKIENRWFNIKIDYKNSKSLISVMEKITYSDGEVRYISETDPIEVSYCIKGLNPQNFLEKIQTYLTFS